MDQELWDKLKHKTKVICTIEGARITDARISVNKGGSKYICQNIYDGANADDKLGYSFSYSIAQSENFAIEVLEGLRAMSIGDIIIDRNNDEEEIVLDVFENTFITDGGIGSAVIYSFEEAETGGMKLKDGPDSEETIKIGEYEYNKKEVEDRLKDLKTV